MAMKLTGRERSRRIIDIIAHQCSMYCPKEWRKKIVAEGNKANRLFWSKESGRIKRPAGVVGELLLLETCVYRCVSAIKETIERLEK